MVGQQWETNYKFDYPRYQQGSLSLCIYDKTEIWKINVQYKCNNKFCKCWMLYNGVHVCGRKHTHAHSEAFQPVLTYVRIQILQLVIHPLKMSKFSDWIECCSLNIDAATKKTTVEKKAIANQRKTQNFGAFPVCFILFHKNICFPYIRSQWINEWFYKFIPFLRINTNTIKYTCTHFFQQQYFVSLHLVLDIYTYFMLNSVEHFMLNCTSLIQYTMCTMYKTQRVKQPKLVKIQTKVAMWLGHGWFLRCWNFPQNGSSVLVIREKFSLETTRNSEITKSIIFSVTILLIWFANTANAIR